MKFNDFLNELLLTESKVDVPYASAILLVLYNGKDLKAFGNSDEYSDIVKIGDSLLKKRLSNIAGTKSPRGITRISFEGLASIVLDKEVKLDDTDVYVNDKKVGNVDVDSTWVELIDTVPGLKQKLKTFHDTIENKIVAASLKV